MYNYHLPFRIEFKNLELSYFNLNSVTGGKMLNSVAGKIEQDIYYIKHLSKFFFAATPF